MFIQIRNEIPDDCYILTISKAMNMSYDEVAKKINKHEESWGKFLLDNGFELVNIPAVPFKKRITVKELSNIIIPGYMIVCRCGQHILHIYNNNYYDETDTGNECVFHYYKKKILG